MAYRNYHDQFKIDSNLKLREQIKKLPAFCSDFFRGIEPTTSERTRNAYAYDLIIFFNYIKTETYLGVGKEIYEYPISILDSITPTIIQDFLEYLKIYNNSEDTERINSERGQMRKLSTLRSFYNYFYRMEKIKNNPASIVPMPKLREKNIIRLDSGEIKDLLEEVETGNNMSSGQQKFHDKTKVRDTAIITLLLGTGIRVSECVGLDLNDVDFKNHGIRIIRKGGKEVVVYFGDEVESALFDYIRERNSIVPLPGHENAFFLSLQKRRISVRAVQNLVEKYASQSIQLKHITPHKLRSTYGTQLYKETGDIYLVADVLGHSDVNTTKKHYAAIEDERRRSARNIVTLRGDHDDDQVIYQPDPSLKDEDTYSTHPIIADDNLQPDNFDIKASANNNSSNNDATFVEQIDAGFDNIILASNTTNPLDETDFDDIKPSLNRINPIDVIDFDVSEIEDIHVVETNSYGDNIKSVLFNEDGFSGNNMNDYNNTFRDSNNPEKK